MFEPTEKNPLKLQGAMDPLDSFGLGMQTDLRKLIPAMTTERGRALRICDVGGGSGALLGSIQKQFPQACADLCLIDPGTPEYVNMPGVRVERKKIQNLDQRSAGSYDLLLAKNTLCYCAPLDLTLLNIYKLLANEGKAIFNLVVDDLPVITGRRQIQVIGEDGLPFDGSNMLTEPVAAIESIDAFVKRIRRDPNNKLSLSCDVIRKGIPTQKIDDFIRALKKVATHKLARILEGPNQFILTKA